jgi:Transglycosylase-like domain
MRNRIAATALGLALLGVPAVAQADNNPAPGAQQAEETALLHRDFAPYEKRYMRLYHRVADKFGAAAAGRDLVLAGARSKSSVHEASRGKVVAAADGFWSKLHPEPDAEPTYTETTETTTYAPAASSTVTCESGGDYSANTGNGYYGGYQFDSGTWDAYGDPAYAEASDAPPAAQDAAAASVPYDAWPSCP